MWFIFPWVFCWWSLGFYKGHFSGFFFFVSLCIQSSSSIHSKETGNLLKDLQDSEYLDDKCGTFLATAESCSQVAKKQLQLAQCFKLVYFFIFQNLAAPVQGETSKQLLADLMGRHILCEIIPLDPNTYRSMKWIRIIVSTWLKAFQHVLAVQLYVTLGVDWFLCILWLFRNSTHVVMYTEFRFLFLVWETKN